jgi:hypothetical protein
MDVLDTLTGGSFDDVYTREIEPELRLREADRRKALGTFAIVMFAGVLLVVIESLVTSSWTHGRTAIPDPRVWAFTLALAGVIGYLPVMGVAQAAKVDVLGALCKPLGVAYELNGFEAPAFQKFLDLHLLPKPDGKAFEDHFTGQRGGRAFELCEATLTQGSGRGRSTVFQGQLFKIAFPKTFDAVTVVLRDSGWLNRFECPPGLAKVGLEDPKFEHTFEVFGSDQVEARAILTPSFMEEILALEAAYAGEHIRCAFVEGDLLIALQGKDRFEIGSMFSSLVDRGRVEAIARDLAAVFKLIDSFVA